MVEIVSWAAGNGDRSENGDYIYGKKRLREIDRRLRHLMKRIDCAKVVDPRRQTQHDRVYFGARVTYVTGAGTRRTVRIVGVDEAGRGCVLGAMVYGAAFWRVEDDEDISARGYDDSKGLTAEVREKRSHVADIAACSRRRLSLTAESEVDHRARHALSRQAEHIDGVTSELAAPTRRHQRIMRSARRVSVAS